MSSAEYLGGAFAERLAGVAKTLERERELGLHK